MSTSTRSLAAFVTLVFALAGCSAGQTAQTGEAVPAIPGVDAIAGPIQLQNVLVPYQVGGYPAGSDVPLVVRLLSNSGQTVELQSVAPGPGGPMTVTAQRFTLRPATQRLPLAIAGFGCQLLVPPSGTYLVAENLAAPFTYSDQLTVRFTFTGGNAVDVDVPMAPPDVTVTGPALLDSSAGPDVCGSP